MASTVRASATLILDLAAGRARIDDRPVELRPKTWEVLRVLAEGAGRLVTKDELLDKVWADTAVSEGTLSKSIGELRAALDDSREEPRWIETVSRRGFRWIGPTAILAGEAPAPAGATPAGAPIPVPAPPSPVSPSIIARDDELSHLDAAFARAAGGRRQLVFVTGEAGSGKSTVTDHFLERLAAAGCADVAHGLCLETSGPHEPFLPLLDALERLARDPHRGGVATELLRRFAPTWIAQMPSLAPAAAAASSAPGSMLRELATATDELSRDRPLVIVLEDAHWADLATTDAIAALARRRDAARLLVVVTLRNADALVLDHPIVGIRRDLVSRGLAEEVALSPFDEGSTRDYLQLRCPGLDRDGAIVSSLLHQTAGNPLFVRLVVDEWMRRGAVAPGDDGWSAPAGAGEISTTIPDSLRTLLERQIGQLADDERMVVEAASVRIGAFAAASLAGAMHAPPEDVERICDRLSRRGQMLRTAPTATGSDGFAFLHATLQKVVAESLPGAARRRLHLAAAEQIEREHAGRTSTVAALLGLHYEAGGDAARAIRQLRESARYAMHRDAPRDAIVICERILELIDASPSLPEPDEERVLTLVYLTHARQLAFGFVDPKVAELWSRTRELAATTSEAARDRVVADGGRIIVACVSARYAEADEIIRESRPLLELVEDPGARKTYCFCAGTTRYRMGAMDDARQLFEYALALDHETDPVPGSDLNALLMSQYAPAVALAGRPDTVRSLTRRSMDRARAHSHYSECNTATLVGWALCILGDFQGAVPLAERALEIAEADNFRTWTTRPMWMLGMHAMREGRIDEGLARVQFGMDSRRQDGQLVDHSAMCCLVAEALLDAGRSGAAEMLDQAAEFADSTGELYAECEVRRLRARILAGTGEKPDVVETLLRRTIELAVLRGMHWHRLLAASDLAALLIDGGRGEEARTELAPAAAAIEGGADLAAVRRASDLLMRIEGGPAAAKPAKRAKKQLAKT